MVPLPFRPCLARSQNYDPLGLNTTIAWDVYREMWGSDGELVATGNLKEVEYLNRLPEIKVPTLIIVGDHDECDPKMSPEMHERIARSKLIILPNSGQMTFVDQPEMFLKAIRDFVATEQGVTNSPAFQSALSPTCYAVRSCRSDVS